MENLSNSSNPATTTWKRPYAREVSAVEATTHTVLAGLYARLSRDDGTNNQSISIENQIALLQAYAAQRGWEVREVYIDDGFSGTNFERPAFKRMIADAREKRINTIVVKDLSRFGRNHVGVGMYEEQFREVGIRLVSTDNIIDTGERETDPMFAVNNVFNEFYAQQTSRKMRDVKEINARQGKFIGSNAPFGYLKDPDDHHHLIPSEDAPIVLEIFERIARGDNARMVADEFNRRGVATPSVRLNNLYGIYVQRVTERPFWTASTVSNILCNEKYIGHMVQGKRRKVSFKSRLRRVARPEEIVVVENTHEAIVPIDLWNEVQQKRGRSPRAHVGRKYGAGLLAGFIVCADCGGTMTAMSQRANATQMEIVRCSRYTNGGKGACTGHTIRWNHLYQLLLTDIQRNVEQAIQDEAVFLEKLQAHLSAEDQKRLASDVQKLATMQGKHKQLEGKLESLYEEKWEKGMPEAIFQKMLARYNEEKAQLERDIAATEQSIQAAQHTTHGAEKLMERMKEHGAGGVIDKLTRHLLGELIDKVVVHEREKHGKEIRQTVEIHYKFVGQIGGQDAAQDG